jgi:hypothetical protein
MGFFFRKIEMVEGFGKASWIAFFMSRFCIGWLVAGKVQFHF